MNICLLGGGTGGHITPLASFISYLQKDKKNNSQIKSIVWFGEKNSLEEKLAMQFHDVVHFQPIYTGKIRRYITGMSIILNIRDMRYQIYGIIQSFYYLQKYRIDGVFCKGGYASFGVSVAAYCLGIPIIVHESDTVGGLTNHIVAKMAKKVFSGFSLPGATCIGQLLSPALSLYSSSELQEHFVDRYDKEKTTFLLMGGSQGSQAINDAMLQYIDSNRQFVQQCQIIILGGSKNTLYKEKFEQYSCCKCFGFLDIQDVAYIYSLTDVSLTRSSATSVAEQKIFGIQCIYVPLPNSGGNHQYYNALEFVRQYPKDIILDQNTTFQSTLDTTITTYIGYKKTKQEPFFDDIYTAHIQVYMAMKKYFQQKKKR